MKPTSKILYIERENQHSAQHHEIPAVYHDQLIPYARYYYYEDEDGAILDQHIRTSEFSIWVHNISMRPGIELRPVAQHPVIALHAAEQTTSTAPQQEVGISSMMTTSHTTLPAANSTLRLHINIAPATVPHLANEFPAMKALADIPVSAIPGPLHKGPFLLNTTSRRIRNRILNGKYIGDTAYNFFRRNAADFFGNYSRRLAAPAPIMMNQLQHTLLQDIFSYIVQNLHLSHTYQEIQQQFNVEKALLLRPFEQEFHVTLPELVLQEKMALAFELLSTRSVTISGVMEKTGFHSHTAFMHTFEHYYKCGALQVMDAQ
ncbi:helix-turn-helix transcriptional regulator [Chitinophaga solisilvae]|uniref:helix-turn-helix transcriptional regulator n=1 Tax=Chitinophaga solisilvae TaxID=1233460 RepID=UPI00136DED35|nr:helix-turn-helix transcriptional regulator [Chitinophaga solisilvae]